MGRRGPQPKPTAIRIIEGISSPSQLGTKEPQPPKVSAVDPPNWLDPTAKNYWRRIVPMLANIGMLTEADLPTIERYCDFLSQWKQCRDFLAEAGDISYPIYEWREIDDPKNPGQKIRKRELRYMQEFPHMAKKLKISEHLLRIEQHFGMTPAARTRIMIDPPPQLPGQIRPPIDDDDPFAVN